MDALHSALRTLATDSNKHRAKADRRRQRSTFRAVLHFVEVRGAWARSSRVRLAQPQAGLMGPSPLQGGECEEETVRFGLEVLYVDSWARRRIYAAFKAVLGSGMHHHLQVERLAGRGPPACLLQTSPSSLSSLPPEQRATP